MEVEKSLKVLKRIWGNREGYVFLPWIDGDSNTKTARRNNYHEGRAFEWPKDQPAILRHMQNHTNDDLYFCPNLFLMKRRSTNVSIEEKALWADLDEIDPREIDSDLQPTIAWESSPGRYQAIWLLTDEALLASESGGLGQRLTYYLGADLGGWDSTQLLRPPGWHNHKPDYREKYGKPPLGKLLWSVGPRYDPADLDADLPKLEISSPTSLGNILEGEIEQVNRAAVIARIRNKLHRKVKRLLDAKTTEGRDRSATLFYIKRSLAEVGCTLAEIVAVVRPTVWNKFAGRNDELKRLTIEATKAIEKHRQKGAEGSSTEGEGDEDEESDFEVAERPKPKLWADLAVEMGKPKWLIKDIWTKGACGIIAGAPKSMKSYVALDLAFSIATGTDFLGKYPVTSPGPILYIQEEDPVPEIDQRIARLANTKAPEYHPQGYMTKGEGPREIYWGSKKLRIYGSVRNGFAFSEPEDQEWLDEQLGERQYKAVILDPLGMFLGDIDDHRFGDMNTHFLKPLKQLADKHGVAVILVHHTTKTSDNTRGRIGSALLGSRALHAWTEDYLFVTRKNDLSNELKIQRESKRAPGLLINLHPSFQGGKWEPNISENDSQEEVGNGSVNPKLARSSVYKALVELGEGFHTPAVISEQSGILRNSVYKQLKRLEDQGAVTQNGKGWALTGG